MELKNSEFENIEKYTINSNTKTSNFSIDYILTSAGTNYDRIKFSVNECPDFLQNPIMPMFDWLQYTRYHPPRLPRPIRSGPVKRAPGRLPRVPFTPEQLEILENAYKSSTYLSSEEANKLAIQLDLTNTRVKIWFQNRRARERREKRDREEENSATKYSPNRDVLFPYYKVY